MPLVELSGNSMDVGSVLSVMIFPNDRALREQYLAARQTRATVLNAKPDQIFLIDANTLTLLIDGPGSDQINQLAQEKIKKAMVAGNLLATIYLMDAFSIPEPSMNKAIFVAQQYAKTATYGDATRMNRSERPIWEAWREFKDVAHFWAAFELNKSYPYSPQGKIFSPDNFGPFLSVASGLANFGVSFIPFRAKPQEPVLDPNTVWALPESISPTLLKSECRPKLLEKTLRNYRAPIQY